MRTESQKVADQELEAAIVKCLKEYGLNETGEVIADFVVLCATNRIHDDGVVQTDYPILIQNGDMPWYRITGLMEMHRMLAFKSMGGDNG